MRRTYRWLAAALLAVQGLIVGVAPAAVAQTEAGVGTEVPFVDDEGVARGTIEVRELNDPFEGFDPTRLPEPGNRYVGLVVAFTAADDQSFDTNPYGVVLRTLDGRLYNPTYIPRPADDPLPDHQAQSLSPGDRTSGFVGYIIPSDAAISEIVYVPSTYRAIPLVTVAPAAAPAPGAPVPFTGGDGSQAQITLELMDQFTDPAAAPIDGMRFAGVKAVIENTGTTTFDANPTEIYLRDANGYLIYPQGVSREDTKTLPDLQSQPLAPGDRVSGFIGYRVPTDAALVAIDLWEDGGRRFTLADLVAGGPAPTAGPVVTPAPAPSVTPPPPVPSPTPGQSAGVSQ